MKVTQCLTPCCPIDYTVHGILQARILEWVAFLFSRGSSQPRDQTQVSLIVGGFFTSLATREDHWTVTYLLIILVKEIKLAGTTTNEIPSYKRHFQTLFCKNFLIKING